MEVVNKYASRVATVHDVSVMRPHPLSNQWSHKDGTYAKYRVETREVAVAEYENWLRSMVNANDPVVMNALNALTKDSVLICCCKPAQCHGDVIKAVWEELHPQPRNYYAGIGSRNTPFRMCEFMTKVAGWMEQRNWVLRSGGANGADTAFAAGVLDDDNEQIFLPWTGFNNNKSPWSATPYEAFLTVDQFHPTPYRLSQAVRKMMARNACQVLGPDLKIPSKMVICWTPGGSGEGGTGQAIRIANHYGIAVHDLGNQAQFDHVVKITRIVY